MSTAAAGTDVGQPEPTELLALACRLADAAGDRIRAAVGGGVGSIAVTTKSTATDMVTEVDRDAERIVVAGIRAARPHDAVMGEEGTDHDGTSGVRWVIDPIDGTTNFVYGHHQVAVSIAVEVHGHAVAGVVDAPLLGERFTAVRGGGAHRHAGGRTERLSCSALGDLTGALVGTGFGYDAGRRARQAALLTTVLPAVRDVRRLGSAALDLCWVACGRLDAYYELGLNHWDVAAGALVATEAGAVVRPLVLGQPLLAGTLVACAPPLEDALVTLLTGAGADQ